MGVFPVHRYQAYHLYRGVKKSLYTRKKTFQKGRYNRYTRYHPPPCTRSKPEPDFALPPLQKKGQNSPEKQFFPVKSIDFSGRREYIFRYGVKKCQKKSGKDAKCPLADAILYPDKIGIFEEFEQWQC